jgi:hypothetical protein
MRRRFRFTGYGELFSALTCVATVSASPLSLRFEHNGFWEMAKVKPAVRSHFENGLDLWKSGHMVHATPPRILF